MPTAAHTAVRQRNGALDCCRFIFSIVIFLFHFFGAQGSPLFSGGYLAVEFFFVAGGCLLAQRIERQTDSAAPAQLAAYAGRRFVRLYPPYLLVLAAVYAISFSAGRFWPNTVRLFFDVSFLSAFGFPPLAGLLWYVSAGFIATAFLYWLALAAKRHFLPLLAFGCPALLGLLFSLNGSLSHTNAAYFPATTGVLRALAETGIGCLVWTAVQQLAPRLERRAARIALSFAEPLLLAALLYMTFRPAQDARDFLALGLAALLTGSMMTGASLWSRLGCRLTALAGEISYHIYLVQILTIEHLYPRFPQLMHSESLVLTALEALCINLLLAAALLAVCRLLEKAPRRA
ncbi:MAG: acyltransferase [Oscillospiraceae bacterium]|nr:acyltransferase [Oscillospiraceae bacterium]